MATQDSDEDVPGAPERVDWASGSRPTAQARMAALLAAALAALGGRADRLRARDELRRLPDRTLADLGLRRIDVAPAVDVRAGRK